MPRHEPTSDALELLDRMVGDDAELRGMLEEEGLNAQVAREIHDLRSRRGLTQKDLAERIGTSRSVIARLEDADYEGHSLRTPPGSKAAKSVDGAVPVETARNPRNQARRDGRGLIEGGSR